MRVRLLVAGFAMVVSLWVWIPTAAGAVGAAQTGSTHAPSSVSECKEGGWQSLTNAEAQPFRTQGECIAYLIHNPVSLADLTGSFSGTTSWTFGNGCPFVSQVFDGTYPGISAVGAVTLHVGGCVAIGGGLALQFSYAGAFAIATSVGTLNGNAAGPITNVVISPVPTDFELTLTVLSGTGAFAATTGTIHVSILWPAPPLPGFPSSSPVTGSVTIP
jgi:hypothetical protein